MAEHEKSREEEDQNQKPRKPFEPPRLHVYGDIAALTRKVGRSGVPDGGGGAKSRTSP